MYDIKPYTKRKAKLLGVKVKPSINKGKKIDVYKNNEKIASIGDINYSDYPTFLKNKGKTYADVRRKAYKSRHEKDRNKSNTAGFYADKLLW
jgi:hypothetical protein